MAGELTMAVCVWKLTVEAATTLVVLDKDKVQDRWGRAVSAT